MLFTFSSCTTQNVSSSLFYIPRPLPRRHQLREAKPFLISWYFLNLSKNYPLLRLHLLIKRYNLYKLLACWTTFFQLSLFCPAFFQLLKFMLFISPKTLTFHVPMSSSSFYILLTCLDRLKIICPAFPPWAFLASSFPVCELASRQTSNLEHQGLSGVISPRRIAFTTAEDSRLAPAYPWGWCP